MIEELKDILRDAYIRERKLGLLYESLAELDSGRGEEDSFFIQARSDQQADMATLETINRKYGGDEIDPNVLTRMGQTLASLRAGRREREELIRQVLEYETQLVEVYKSSLRHLTSDDESRKLVNSILTVKLGHRRDLMSELDMF
jgi:hypothetical protein